MIDWFNHSWYFVDKGNGARDVVEDRHLANLFPGIRDVLEQLHNGVRNVFQSTEVHSLVVPEFAVAHVAMVFYDLAYVFRRQVLDSRKKLRRVRKKSQQTMTEQSWAHLLPLVDESALPIFPIALVLHLDPLVRLLHQNLTGHA